MAGPKGQVFEAEVYRYLDEATEFQVHRLTDPAYTSTLPGPASHTISRNSGSLLYCSDRSGSPQAFRLDLKSADQQQLTDRKDLDGRSLTLLPDSRSFCFFAGPTLWVCGLGNLRERPVYTVPEGWEPEGELHAAANSAQLFLVERRSAGGSTESRLRAISLPQGAARTVLEAPFGISDPVERPHHAQILYRQAGKGLCLVEMNGEQPAPLKLAVGGIGPAFWSADGSALLYLNFPEDPKVLNNIREYAADSRSDKLVAKTSQYAAFSPNRDGSVFVGASRNKASPAVLIMLRITRRELTLCEHRASHPERVSPLFSPDAQRIYFQSDRHGKSAIYALHVERLVERIDDEGQ
jgi:oligogalacturonide lyase